jgi:uncharacterized protein (UPF0332 family)
MLDENLRSFVHYRLTKAEETYQAAVVLYGAEQWNSCINRLYYACFYAASAILLEREISAKSHAGVIGMFSETLVRTGEISIELFRVYSKLLSWRSKGDYGDFFDFTKEDVDSVLVLTKQFIDKVNTLVSMS